VTGRGPLPRALFDLGVTTAGLAWATASSVLPVPRSLQSLASVLSFVDAIPVLRAPVVARAGGERVLTVGNAVAQAVAQRPLGLFADALCALSAFGAHRAQQAAWRRAGLDVPEEPAPAAPPAGPAARAANRLAGLALAGFAATLLVSRDRGRATAMLAAGTPKPARLGPQVFASELARHLADREVLVRDPAVLRLLGRVDTVVIDTRLLHTGRYAVDEVRPVNGADVGEVYEHAHELVDPSFPWHEQRVGPWAVWPQTGGRLLELSREGTQVGMIEVAPELAPLAETLVASARRAGRVLLTAADDRVHADDVVPAEIDLADTVRALRADGHVVAVVSDQAIDTADVSVGLTVRSDADVLCPRGLVSMCVLLDAAASARQAEARAAQLAVIGAGCASVLTMIAPRRQATDRATLPVNVAALIAIGAGVWLARRAARRPEPAGTDRTAWHVMSPDTVLRRLGSSPEGIDNGQVAARRSGNGAVHDHEQETLLHAAIAELDNPLTPALATSAGVSATIGSVVDATLIMGVLGVNALLGGAQRLRATKTLNTLAGSTAVRTRVRRNGEIDGVTAELLVPGDVIELEAGDVVPADCRVLTAEGLEVDESSLTGESGLVGKQSAPSPAASVADRRCMAYQGTAVAAGRGSGIVVATNGDTELGRTGRAGERRTGGVGSRLTALAKVTIPLSVGAGLLLTATDLLRGRRLGHSVVRGIGLAVAAVPEGLPFVATVAELAAARRLSRRGALVRNPSTIEALGRVDVLCFDKTGTLTQGHLALRRVFDGATEAVVDELPAQMRTIVAAALRASPRNGQRIPHPTDRAVIEGAGQLGIGTDDDRPGWHPVIELPFEPSRGYHAVLGRSPQDWTVTVKGAPEVLLPRCTTWRGAPLDEATRTRLDKEFHRLAARGYRVLVVAERTASSRRELDATRVNRLGLIGLLAMADPVRPSAREAVHTLRGAGIDVVMVTGDHPGTAAAIAEEVDALGDRDVLTGPELDVMTDEELIDRLPGIAVFARVSPAQKARIVAALQTSGKTVAVTGDGANDAPAIRLAEVGLALGEHATTAAREAADVVITDNRIETITDAVVEGRAMWASVREGLAILLGGNIGEIAFTVAAGVLSARETLNVRQLLLINLLTDALPAMAVATRPPADRTPESLLAEGPDASLGTALNRQITVRAITTAAAGLVSWLLSRITGAPWQASTTALVGVVAAQLGQTIAVRGRTPIVLASGVVSLAALGLVVQIPGLSHFFGCRPLFPHQWAIALTAALVATLVARRIN